MTTILKELADYLVSVQGTHKEAEAKADLLDHLQYMGMTNE